MTSWQSQIDNKDFVEPSAIHGLANGSDALKQVLHPIHDHEGDVVGLAAPAAAQSYDAMVKAAWADGVVLKPSSSADTFRPLSTQQSIFTDRYRETDQGNGSRVCGGKRWYLRKGKATAACPGTSNHGKGCAVDFDLQFPGSLAWLEDHAKSFGWQWEVTSEDWHLHYMLGDRLPAGVHDTPTVQEDDDMPYIAQLTADMKGYQGQDYAAGFAVLVVGQVRTHIDKPADLDALKADGVPVKAVGGLTMAAIFNSTVTDIHRLLKG